MRRLSAFLWPRRFLRFTECYKQVFTSMELKLGSIPVRIQGWFIMMALLLGANERQPAKLGIWVVVVVVSVVIHELGHALVGRAFGLAPSIDLHGMGGTTSFQAMETPEGQPRPVLGTAKRVAISLAGPFAGFLFALVVFVARLAGFQPEHPLALYAVSLLFMVNVGWGVFNLLPMLPLDGGNVLTSILKAISSKNGDKLARGISVVVAASIALYAVGHQQWWVLYLGVLFAFRNVQALRQAGQMQVDQALAGAIEQAYQALDREQPKEALALLGPALATNASSELRQLGVRVYVVSLLKEGRWPEAVDTIERERSVMAADDLERFALAMREIGRSEDADRVEALRKAGPPIRAFRA